MKKYIKLQINRKGHNNYDPSHCGWYLTIFFFRVYFRYSVRHGLFANDLRIYIGDLSLEFLWNPNVSDICSWTDRINYRNYPRRQWMSCKLYKNWGELKNWRIFSIFESEKSYEEYKKAKNNYLFDKFGIGERI